MASGVKLSDEVLELGRCLPTMIEMIRDKIKFYPMLGTPLEGASIGRVKIAWTVTMSDGRELELEIIEGLGKDADYAVTLTHSPRCVGDDPIPTLQVRFEGDKIVVSACD